MDYVLLDVEFGRVLVNTQEGPKVFGPRLGFVPANLLHLVLEFEVEGNSLLVVGEHDEGALDELLE